MSQESNDPTPPLTEQNTKTSRWPIVGTLLVLTLVSVVYRLLIGTEYATTSALYVGIPALMAIGLSFIPSPRTVTGNILLWSTIFLLGLSILAIEGLICILIILPFFLAVGFIVGIFIDKARAKENGPWKTQCSFLVIAALMSLEGTQEELSFQRHETVVVQRTLELTPLEFEQALAQGPDFEKVELPTILSGLFPSPLPTKSPNSLAPSTVWNIPFDHGESTSRILRVQVKSKSENQVTFATVQDDTEYGNWLAWKTITWTWQEVAPQQTQVTATFEFERRLDPAFYFQPLQRWGVAKAGEYFLDAILAP